MKMVFIYLGIASLLLIGIFLFINSRQEMILENKNPEDIQIESERQLETVSDTELYLKNLGYDTTKMTMEELKLAIEQNQENLKQEFEKNINKSIPGLVGIGGKEWTFNTEFQDELNLSVVQISDVEFAIFPQAVSSKVNQPKYNWKAVLNISDEILVLVENKTLSDLTSPIFFKVPRDIEYFELSLGQSSTLINASALATGMAHSTSDNFVINSSGGYLATYTDLGSDIQFAWSNDYGKTWTSKIVYVGLVSRTGLVLAPNGTVFIYGLESSNIIGLFSANGGGTFGSMITLADTAGLLNMPSCAVSSANVFHCSSVSGIGGVATSIYFNSTMWNSTTAPDSVNANGGNNTNEVDIEVGSNGQPYVIGVGTDFDCVDIWSPALRGWGDTNRKTVYCSLSYTEGNNADITIRNVNTSEQIVITSTIRGAIRVANSSISSANTSWSLSTEFDTTSGKAEASGGITMLGWYEGMYSNSTSVTDGSALFSINSSGFVQFTRGVVRQTNGFNHPHIADSHYPDSNRLDGTNGTVHYIMSDNVGNIYYDNYRFPKEPSNSTSPTDTCTCVTTGDWIVSGTDSCVLTTNCVMQVNSFFSCNGSGFYTIRGGNLSGFQNYLFHDSCNLNVVDGGKFGA